MRIYTLTLLLFTLVLAGCEQGELSDYKADYDMSVMSFNLRYDEPADKENQWDNRKAACIEMIEDKQPMVLGIQEGLYNQVRYLDENLSDYSYVGVGRDDGYSGGEYAAIFYDSDLLTLQQSGNFWLSETPEYPSIGWDANNIRIVTWAKFKDVQNNQSIYVFNTHFDHKGRTAQEKSSQLLVSKILEIVDEATVPIFITGDFNMLVGNSRLSSIIENYFSARRFAFRSDNIPSYNAWGIEIFNRNIDFVFYQHVAALSFKTVTADYGVDYISDHYPIIAHFDYQ